jgi:flotillin
VQTQRERAMAERSREIAMKRVQEQGEVAAANADSDSAVLIKRAQAESQAVRTKADADRIRLLAESEGKKAVIAAENSRSDSVMGIQLERYRLERMPEILAQLMKPVEKIDSIKIHQLSGFGGAPGSTGASGGDNRPPVNQVMDSIMGMALQLPALKSIGDSIGYDFTSALPKPKNPPDDESKDK